MNFQERLEKGYDGERIILNYLIDNGYTVYINSIEKKHPVDMVCIDKDNKVFYAEVKTKNKLRKYNGTGINVNHLETYLSLQRANGINVFIYFVDFSLRCIYGNYLDKLLNPVECIENGRKVTYPFETGRGKNRVIIFSLSNMKMVSAISEKFSGEVLKRNPSKLIFGYTPLEKSILLMRNTPI